jgi:Inorganic pyrophosphatase
MSDNLVAVVEIPKGSSNKYEWDDELGAIKHDRLLFSSLGYPTDYGFFRDTLASDGDPLDAMIAVSEPTFPGCLIEVKPEATKGLHRYTSRTAPGDSRTNPGCNTWAISSSPSIRRGPGREKYAAASTATTRFAPSSASSSA